MSKSEDMQGVLDAMTIAIGSRKQAQVATLTPVGTEKGGPLDGKHVGAPFPYDDADIVKQAVVDARKLVASLQHQIKFITDGLDALAPLYGVAGDDDVDVVTPEQAQRQAEKAADQAHFERKQEELRTKAKASVYEPEPEPAPFTPEPKQKALPTWACPTHGADKVKLLTSRKGRSYGVCGVSGCEEFER